MKPGQFCNLIKLEKLKDIKLSKKELNTISTIKSSHNHCLFALDGNEDKAICALVFNDERPYCLSLKVNNQTIWISYLKFYEVTSKIVYPSRTIIVDKDLIILQLKRMNQYTIYLINKERKDSPQAHLSKKQKRKMENSLTKAKKEKIKNEIITQQKLAREEKRKQELKDKYESIHVPSFGINPNSRRKEIKNKKSDSQVGKVKILNKNFANASYLTVEDIVEKIQLIKSSNNHVSINHKTVDKTIKLGYQRKDSTIGLLEIVVHYCEQCNIYFDFYTSFKDQLNKIGIKLESIITCFVDEKGNEITFTNLGLNEKSKLSILGYSVGMKGLPSDSRHRILEYAMKSGYISPTQIKNHLNFLIRYNGAKSNMEKSIADWRNDIQFVNRYIINKK